MKESPVRLNWQIDSLIANYFLLTFLTTKNIKILINFFGVLGFWGFGVFIRFFVVFSKVFYGFPKFFFFFGFSKVFRGFSMVFSWFF